MGSDFNLIIHQMAEKIKDWEIDSLIPDRAANLIAELRPWETFTTDSFTRDLIQRQKIPLQFSFSDGFGQPAITLWSNENFRIELYFWSSSNTSIHSHSFAGAFTVLSGVSFQGIYKIQNTEREISEGTSRLICSGKTHAFIYPGKIQKIVPGDAFCHDVIHLVHPTVTFIIRTNKPIGEQYQALNKASFAFNFITSQEIQTLNKQLALLNLQSQSRPELLKTFLGKLSLHYLFNLYVNSSMWGFRQNPFFEHLVASLLDEKLKAKYDLSREEVLRVECFEDSDDPLAVLTSCAYYHSLSFEELESLLKTLPVEFKTILNSGERSLQGDLVYDKLCKLLT